MPITHSDPIGRFADYLNSKAALLKRMQREGGKDGKEG